MIEEGEIKAKNKKASHEYFLMDKKVAGISLSGTEIKSIRDNKASIVEAYCTFMGDELYIRNMYIAEYAPGSYNNHEPRRERKLLMKRNELNKLKKKLKDVGLTCIPTKLFISKNGLAKLEIAIAKGKKLYDKRHDLKEKDDKRQIQRNLKEY
ncbi:MAG: SsrA-binding protein [Patiriisocius sp.]|jgi:SsrA-binding protein